MLEGNMLFYFVVGLTIGTTQVPSITKLLFYAVFWACVLTTPLQDGMVQAGLLSPSLPITSKVM